MPEEEKKYYDAEGNEVEAISAEEVEAQKAEAIETYKTEHPDEDIEVLQKQIEEKEEEVNIAKEELEKLGKKDFNFQKLREQNKTQESELDKLKTEMSEKLDQAITNLAGDKKADIINSLVGDDEELKKKVEFHYDRIKDEAKTKDEIQSKVNDAYFLATRQEAPTGNYVSSAGAGNVKNEEQITPGEKEIGDALGITDEDRKKFNK